MKLEVGKTYERDDGARYTVMGRCAFFPQFIWTNVGDWFDPESGRFVHFIKDGHYAAAPVATWRDLVREGTDEPRR